MLGRNLVQQLGQFGRGDIGARNIELVIQLVVGCRGRSASARGNRPALVVARSRSLASMLALVASAPEQRVHFGARLGVSEACRDPVAQPLKRCSYSGFAAETRDGEVKGVCPQRYGGQGQ